MAVILILLNEQLLSDFLEKSRNFRQLLKKFGATFKKFWSNLWLRLLRGTVNVKAVVIHRYVLHTYNLMLDAGHKEQKAGFHVGLFNIIK